MENIVIRAQVAKQLRKIVDLESDERSYISLLETQTSSVQCYSQHAAFQRSHNIQDERSSLYSVRVRIFNYASTLLNLLKVLQNFDPELTKEYRALMVDNMKLRHNQLLREAASGYYNNSNGTGGDTAVSMEHVQKNLRLATRIREAFELPDDD
ncbi:hypothetical protein BGW39_009095 [Mortierella sp. 14UC]|nr:hypothetical protein BGW39_009095 [Mortierella sp. 14UC]